MDLILTCDQCGAKLKVRAASPKLLKEVACAKCQRKFSAAAVAAASAGVETGGGGTPPAGAGAASASAFPCPLCGKRLLVARSLAGKKIRCNFCREVVQVPEAETPPEGAAARAAPAAARPAAEPAAQPAAARPAASSPAAPAGGAATEPSAQPAATASLEPRIAALEEALGRQAERIEAVSRQIDEFCAGEARALRDAVARLDAALAAPAPAEKLGDGPPQTPSA
jgi:hypothetical protein